MTSNRLRALVTLASIVVAGCLGPDVELLDTDGDADASSERLRRMNFTVVPVSGTMISGTSTVGEAIEVLPSTFADLVVQHCSVELHGTPAFSGCGNSGDACSTNYVCPSQAALCQALMFRELGSAVGVTLLQSSSNTPAARVPPQDAESRAALQQLAQRSAAAAIYVVLDAFADASSCEDGRLELPIGTAEGTPVPDQSTAEVLASTVVEALRLGEAAARDGGRIVAGVAERDLTGLADRGRGARLAWFDRNLSRLVALQAHTGGLGELDGTLPMETGELRQDPFGASYLELQRTGIGGQPPCNGHCGTALSLLRASGARFERIVDDPAVVPDGATSLRSLIRNQVSPRLAERLNRPELDAMNEEQLASAFGLTANHFRQARARMVHEGAVFARPIGYRAPVPALMPAPDGTPRVPPAGRFDRTTMASPTPPPVVHYVTAGRSALWREPTHRFDALERSVPIPQRSERAYFVDAAHTVARRAIADERLAETEAGARMRGIFATIIQDATARGAARTEVCSRNDGVQEGWRIRVFGVPASRLRIVEGTPALRCATEGKIEDEACSLSNPAPAPTNGREPDHALGWADYVQWMITGPATGQAPARPYWYVVRRREDRESGPGAFEAIAGIPWTARAPTQGEWSCISLPFDRESFGDATTIFELDADMSPAVACADTLAGGPIPLEDEIIDDGDRFETSWRHHLRTARRSADRADELGQRLLQAGLTLDQEAQRAADRVVDLCGVPLNLSDLFNAGDGAAEAFSLNQLVHTMTCDEVTAPTMCPPRYTCVGTSCVASILAPAGATSFETEALLSCLGVSEASANVDVVALGTEERPICYWYRNGARQILCEGARDNCPFEARSRTGNLAMDCPAPEGLASNQRMAIVAEGDYLGLFPGASGAGSSVPGGGHAARIDCDMLRRLRLLGYRPTSETLDQREIVASGFFDYENVRYWADRIGWVGLPLDFSEFTLDGSPWVPDSITGHIAGTGYPFDNRAAPGPAMAGWPCVTRLSHAIVHGGLFGSTTDCSARFERADFNRRMGRAAATLGALAGVGLSQTWLPTHYEGLSVSSGSVEAGLRTVHDLEGRPWRIGSSAEFGEDGRLSGMVVVPPSNFGRIVVWTSINDVGDHDDGNEEHGVPGDGAGEAVDRMVTESAPFGFLNHGAAFQNDDDARARTIARRVWRGLAPGSPRPSGSPVPEVPGAEVGDLSIASYHDGSWVAYAALVRADLPEHAPLWSGRRNFRQRHLDHLTHLFSRTPWDATNRGEDQFRTNRAHIFEDQTGSLYRSDFTRRDVLDAMELMCEVARSVPENSLPQCRTEPGAIYSMADVGRVQAQMRCAAERLDQLAIRQVAQNLPRDVVHAIRGEAGDVRPDVGEYGRVISRLRTALRARAEAPRQIADQLRDAARDIELLKSNVSSVDAERAISYLQNLSQAVDTLVQCAGSQFGAACGIAAAQLGIALATSALQRSNLDREEERLFLSFSSTMQARATNLATLEASLQDGADAVESILAELRQSRQSAQSALAQAAFAGSDAAGRQYQLNTALRRVYNVDLYRYEAAHRAAVRHAIVARRAVEQRFGVNLAEVGCASLVDPPRTWADDVCNATGINYAAIRDPEALEPTPDTVRQMFLGDYVSRLEDYVESYRFDNPYTSGDDAMVVSVRNDLIRARGPCSGAADNLVGASNDLREQSMPSETGTRVAESRPAWHVPAEGCLERPSGAEEEDLISVDCVDVEALELVDPMTGAPVVGLGASGPTEPARPFRVTFGRYPADTDYTDDAAWVQELLLPVGLYRLSWYSPATSAAAAGAVDIRGSAIEKPSMGGVGGVFTADGIRAERLLPPWQRYFRFAFVSEPTVARVGVFPVAGAALPQVIDVAGIQLERVDRTVGTRSTDGPSPMAEWRSLTQMAVDAAPGVFHPVPFFATTAPGFARYLSCPTDDPGTFLGGWRYDCASLCAGGFSERCAEGERAETFCYWEAGFALTEEQLVGRTNGFEGGFAFGNFNYRTGNVAFNVVGTGIRDCRGTGSSACFGTANVPISLVHRPLAEKSLTAPIPGAYGVRTHEGSVHPVYLFDGRIESARALAAERYLTSPLSSADRSLLADYWRSELRGRPLPGHYTLRIWDIPGIDVTRIEDIQLAWEYRYFTRTGERLSCGGDE
ncbi:MAG: hypothetical protein KF729_36810 [Sandaracinaceae bacterium]|nr:hypothetical protein [Sandaracinaceae bacterium]